MRLSVWSEYVLHFQKVTENISLVPSSSSSSSLDNGSVLRHKKYSHICNCVSFLSQRVDSSELTCVRPQERCPALQIAPDQLTNQSAAGIRFHVSQVTNGSSHIDRHCKSVGQQAQERALCAQWLVETFCPIRFKHLMRALERSHQDWPMKTNWAHVGPRRSQWERRAVNFTLRASRWLFPALMCLFMLLHLSQFKGKRSGGPRAPKLRNHFRSEILEQRVHCEREKEIENVLCVN